MVIRGKQIDWHRLWSNYCDGLDSSCRHTFHPLVLCPYHDNTKSPAFQINLTQPLVHCFSNCNISGTYEHAICRLEGIYEKLGITEEDILNNRKKHFPEESVEIKRSRRKIAKAHREARKIIFKYVVGRGQYKPQKITKPKARTKTVTSESELLNYYYVPKVALAYFEKRGITPDSRMRFELGYDEEAQRITIPVRDERGRLAFIIRRAIRQDQHPKYLYPEDSEKKRLVFGYCTLDQSLIESNGLILVEGPLDAVMMHQAGFRNTVALMGSSLSEEQRKLIGRLKAKRIYLFFDKDAAGLQAATKAGRELQSKTQVRVCRYPKGFNLDPASLTPEQLTHSIARAVTLLDLKKRIKQQRKETQLV